MEGGAGGHPDTLGRWRSTWCQVLQVGGGVHGVQVLQVGGGVHGVQVLQVGGGVLQVGVRLENIQLCIFFNTLYLLYCYQGVLA